MNIKWLASVLKYISKLTKGNTYLEECQRKGSNIIIKPAWFSLSNYSKLSLIRISWLELAELTI